MEADSIAAEIRERVQQIGNADLVVGVLSPSSTPGKDAVDMVREALGKLATPPRTVILQANGAHASSAAEDNSPYVLSTHLATADPSMAPVQNISDSYRSIYALAGKLSARAACVLASGLESVTPQWVCGLVQPVIEKNFDLVTPCYAHHKFEGLLNSCIISPLIRALYGKRIQNPMGPDFGFSGKLLQRMAGADSDGRATGNRAHPLASLAPAAICNGMQVCQAYVGSRNYPPIDWTNLSSLLAQILDPVFLDVERNAVSWQRTRGSHATPAFGDPVSVTDEVGAVEVRRLMESFQLGTRDLLEIWALVLPPATLVELRKLSRRPPEEFRMADEIWVRIVYDFALAHRLRTISRDHMLRAMTPLYLGWVASYALELEAAGALTVDRRLERLAQAYEAGKPYFVSRWRWPDRFNP